jgi:hypothetical protein
LGWSIADLKRSILDAGCASFLRQGRYALP